MKAEFIPVRDKRYLGNLSLFTVIQNLVNNRKSMVIGSVYPKKTTSLLDLESGIVTEWCIERKEDEHFIVLGEIKFNLL
jgi:hypothetical protein